MRKLAYITLLVLASSVVYAHSELTASMPADKAALQSAPKEVMLHFSEAVRLTALSLTKHGEAKQDLGPLPKEMMKDIMIAAPALVNGDYLVNWRAMSDDGHVMTGDFNFSVKIKGSDARGTEHTEHGSHSEHMEHTQHD